MSQQTVQPTEGFGTLKNGNLWCLLVAPGTNFLIAVPERVVCYFLIFQTLAYEIIVIGHSLECVCVCSI